jgi:hypothetical protein
LKILILLLLLVFYFGLDLSTPFFGFGFSPTGIALSIGISGPKASDLFYSSLDFLASLPTSHGPPLYLLFLYCAKLSFPIRSRLEFFCPFWWCACFAVRLADPVVLAAC